MSNVREEVVEDVLNDSECSRNEEQLDGSFSDILPPINPRASSAQNKRVRKEMQKDSVSNIDKVIEHLNKRQKVSALDAIEMLILSHAKTIKTYSSRRQATAKQQISNIIGNLEMDQIEENENLVEIKLKHGLYIRLLQKETRIFKVRIRKKILHFILKNAKKFPPRRGIEPRSPA